MCRQASVPLSMAGNGIHDSHLHGYVFIWSIVFVIISNINLYLSLGLSFSDENK